MTKKRNLTTFMIAIMIMLFSLPVNAQGTVGYAELKGSTLTFYGGESVPDGALALNTGDNAPDWYANRNNCTKVVFDESFKNVRPTSCSKWFNSFSKLTTIQGIENLNTEEVTDMSVMFNGCWGLTSLDLSKFNTAKVTNMTNMFNGCKKLTSLDLSSFNTAKVTNMSFMFNGCSGLTSLDLSKFNTAEVTDMSLMFNSCSALTSLDLSSFNTAKVEQMGGMFSGCSDLTTIYVSDDFTTGKVTYDYRMFFNCTNLKGAASYDSDRTDKYMANYNTGYFTKSNLTPYVKWDANTKVLTFKVANTKEAGSGVYDLNEGANDPGWSTTDIYNNCTKVVFTPSFNHAKPTSCYGWFNNFTKLTTIEGIENLNTEDVTDMGSIFYNCSGLTSLDLSSFNTAKVENMSYMFYGCSGLTTIYVSDDFTTENVSSGVDMFYYCSQLKGAASYDSGKTDKDMANYNTGYFTMSDLTPYVKWDANTKVLTFKVANTKEAGSGVYDLNEGANDPGWSTTDVYYYCTKVVFTPSFKQAKPTSCYKWFKDFSQLTTIEGLENLSTEEVTNMYDMFYNCSGLTSLDLSSFNTAKVTNMSGMFYWCSGLTSLDVSKFNTDEVKDMSGMFGGCKKLTSLNLSSFNTAKVTNMGSIFNTCSSLKSLDLSSFNTAKVENMGYMFSDCSGLTTIYVSDNFSIGNVTYDLNMFSGCSQLKGAASYDSGKIDHTMANYTSGYFTKSSLTPYVKWDTSTKVLTFKVANTKEAGSGVYDLNESANDPGWSIDEVKDNCTKVVFTPSFKQAKPTSCFGWFYDFSQLTTIEGIENLNTEDVTDMNRMFGSCRGLASLDVSSFNTAKVTDMSGMFSDCARLTSLDLSSFNTAKVTNMSGMFYFSTDLTSLDLSSFNTAKVTDMSNMFYGCWGFTSLDLSKFNTDEVTNMSRMFGNCPALTSLNLSSFNTAKVTDMSYMFFGCRELTSLDVSKFNTDESTDMRNMFSACNKLTSLDVSSFNTAKVTDMRNMFSSCKKLTSLDLSSFNTAKVTDMSGMFYRCLSLTTIYVSDDFTTENGSSGVEMFEYCTKLVGAASYSNGKIGISMANYKTGYFKTYFTLGENKVELCGDPLTTKSLDLTGDYDFTPKYEFKANEATYSRDLSSSGSTWFSLCLPFAFTPQNFTAYKLQGASADAVEIEEITGEIAAGTPVLFKFKDGENKEINISATDAQIVKSPAAGSSVTGTDSYTYQLCGTYQEKTFAKDADENAFILLNNKLMNPAKMWENKKVTKVSVKPFRAYMTSTASSLESSARAFSIGFGEDEEGTTAIDQLNTIATDDAEYYDSNGRRISGLVKGLNIVRRGNKTMKLIIK